MRCVLGFLVCLGWTRLLAADAGEPRAVFLLIGQSNMAGRAPLLAADHDADANIWALGKDLQWHPAVDPLHWDKPAVAGVGLGRSFARVLLAHRPGVSIGLVPAAMGGSALEEWKSGGKLFTEAVARTQAALRQNGNLRGILWHQGESDSGDENLARSYDDRWLTMITALRAALRAPDVPVIVGGLGDFVANSRTAGGKISSPFVAQINEQLALLPVRASQVAFVSARGLAHKGDSLHFDRSSIIELGRRYAYTYLAVDNFWAPVVVPRIESGPP